MKILLACLNVNGLGGSELYHYELARELHQAGVDITLFTLREIDSNDQVRIKLQELGVRQLDTSTLSSGECFDLIVASQPQTNQLLLQYYPTTPIISIIHSEIRSEDPILDPRIAHYIGIRQPIVDMLINEYKINNSKVSLIYNPIDTSRFKPTEKVLPDRVRGIFVGEVLDSIRYPTVSHLVQSCIDNDWELIIMSDSRYDFKHPNIKYIDKRWDTETLVKDMNFTGGVLLGRTTLEGLCCNIPGYVYSIDTHGGITGIDLITPGELEQLCNSKLVANQHIQLYNKILKN